MAVKTAKELIKRKADGEESRDWEGCVIADRKLPSHTTTKATSAFAGKNPATCKHFYLGMCGTLCLWEPVKCSLSGGSSLAWVPLTTLNNMILKDVKYLYEYVGCWALPQSKNKSKLFWVMGIISTSLKNTLV